MLELEQENKLRDLRIKLAIWFICGVSYFVCIFSLLTKLNYRFPGVFIYLSQIPFPVTDVY